MTTQEFSNAFDTLLNSYQSQGMFGEQASKGEIVLDEYEKSVLLTQAQDILLKEYFEGGGFDSSIRRQIDFSHLISVAELTVEGTPPIGFVPYDERSLIFKTPSTLVSSGIYKSNVLYVLNEKLIIGNSSPKILVVVPINYREYDRQMSKAYTQPLKKQAWRLYQDADNSAGGTSALYSEIIAPEGAVGGLTTKYKMRYIKRPKPIILVDLTFANSASLQIEGISTVSECELNPIVHMDILNKAVELAYSTRGRGAANPKDK